MTEKQHSGRLRFEKALLEISTRFVNLAADQIDLEIENTQRLICERLGLEVSALWQWSDEAPHFMTLTHLHSPLEGPELPVGGIDAEEAFPWSLSKLLRGEQLVIYTKSMPPEASIDREARYGVGVESSVAFPLSVGRDCCRLALPVLRPVIRQTH